MATTADFRNGLCIEHNGELWTIVEFQHVKPGKGPAFVRTKLKDLDTGSTIEKTFRAGEKMEQADLDQFPPGAPGLECEYCMYWWAENITAELPELGE